MHPPLCGSGCGRATLGEGGQGKGEDRVEFQSRAPATHSPLYV